MMFVINSYLVALQGQVVAASNTLIYYEQRTLKTMVTMSTADFLSNVKVQ